MGTARRVALVVALLLTACAGDNPEPAGAASPAPPPAAIADSEINLANPSAGPILMLAPEPPEDGSLSLGTDRGSTSGPVVNLSPIQSSAYSEPYPGEPDETWRDIPPGVEDEGGHPVEEYRLPPASLANAWTEASPGVYQVLRPATLEELGGYRVIPPPPEALDWITQCVNHHADPSISLSWPQDVRVAQAVLGCTTSAGLMEQAIQRYGANRGCVQQAYSDDYSVIAGQGNSWTRCPTIGNPTPLDGRPFAEKCRDAVLHGLALKGHSPLEQVAADVCPLFEAGLAAHLAVPGATRLCVEHWVLNDVLNTEAPGAVPGLQEHVGVNANGAC